ncbi:MAG: hypothetical protein C3F02_01760 [Parcubacteria group bacterium]|nr:MAG: hypothetical protein C3F02_01760 [Parcubacteria group bacterium]
MDKYFVYIARCADKSLYTGYTIDLKRRETIHNLGCGAVYTRSRRPIKIVYFEEFTTKKDALRRERHIKNLKREDKLMLIKKKYF